MTSTDPWPVPRATRPLDAVVDVPGSKSVTNRALVLAALSDGTSRIVRPLRSRDTELMAQALRVLGATIDDAGTDWVVTRAPGELAPRGDHIDVGNAGTVARFLPAVAGLTRGSIRFDGDARMRERPVGPLLAALRSLGVNIDDGGRGAYPIIVHGTGSVRGGSVEIDASQSSQLVSGLLLAAPRFERGVTVQHAGARLPSTPHIAMTVEMLRAAGATVGTGTAQTWTVAPGPLRARDVTIEPDLSSASYFLAAAAITGGRVVVRGWPEHTVQPGAEFLALLELMGAKVSVDSGGATVVGPTSLQGIDVDLSDAPELAPTLAALAAVASSPSRITGIAHIRLQETDRIAALARELGSLGADVDELPDGLVIRPRPLCGTLVHSHDDHRLAMAFSVLGLVVPGIVLDDVATAGKTVPGFAERWSALVG